MHYKSNLWLEYLILFWGIVQSIISILQFEGIFTSNHSLFNVIGTFDNPGPLGGYLAMSIMIAVSLLCEKDTICSKPFFKYILSFSIVILGLACILADSRATWIALIVALGHIVAKRIPIKKRKISWTVMMILVVITAILLYNYVHRQQMDDS